MGAELNLEQYLNNGIETILKDILKATLKNPKQSAFFAKYILSAKKLKKRRESAENDGEHIPAFLIASITRKCNLHCIGCYARENHSCGEIFEQDAMSGSEWGNIFNQAKELGIGFIILAGGEPLLRKDVIEEAAKYPEILFPIFTNGTKIDEAFIKMIQKYRNLIPVLSIEGSAAITDERRGDGIYEKLMYVMDELNQKGILYGVSLTVTKKNLKNVSEHTFIDFLHKKGCKGIVYVEYVPVDASTRNLTPNEDEREYLSKQLDELRIRYDNMVFLSFPGDERASGGCLAAGRGFFHINANGGAEPCPFSPFSDTSVVDTSLKDALRSPLFMKLGKENVMLEDHIGGCVLFEQEETVRKLLYSQ